jgi:hypothetical protein
MFTSTTRQLTRDSFGPFDASFWTIEHFCSPRHEKAATVLPDDGRLYLQTMVFGRTMIAPEPITSMPSGSGSSARHVLSLLLILLRETGSPVSRQPLPAQAAAAGSS